MAWSNCGTPCVVGVRCHHGGPLWSLRLATFVLATCVACNHSIPLTVLDAAVRLTVIILSIFCKRMPRRFEGMRWRSVMINIYGNLAAHACGNGIFWILIPVTQWQQLLPTWPKPIM